MTFNAKLLLFGEHIILRGGLALAMPWPVFSGQWRLGQPGQVDQQQLPAFEQYVRKLSKKGQLLTSYKLEAFLEDLQKGLYFESSIPVGYGLGSSGALCAAFYARYAEQPHPAADLDYPLLQRILGQLESFFHASSSGIDPLIAYLNHPVLLGKAAHQSVAVPLNDLKKEFRFFVLDTGISRKTGPLVQRFLERCQDPIFFRLTQDEWIKSSDAAIRHLLQAEGSALFECMHRISSFQYRYIPDFIPKPLHALWEQGLNGDHFKLKLCGAGGGGFLLGIKREGYPINLPEWDIIAV